MGLPSFRAAGAGVATTGTGATDVPYPSSIVAGELLALQVTVRDTANAPSAPTDFTLLFGPDSSGTHRQWIYGKIAVGTESGNLSVPGIAGTIVKIFRMYAFQGNRNSLTMEGGGFGTGTDASIEMQAVTTSGPDRLAVTFVSMSDDNTVGASTGETGGDWTEAVAEFTTMTGSDGCLQLQTAAMASAGTITGGTSTQGAADPWVVRAFAIIGKIDKSVSGSISPTGTLVKRTNKTLAGTMTSAGALRRQTNTKKAGTISPAGSLVASLLFLKSVAGAISPSGTLARAVQFAKTVAGSITPTGTLNRAVQFTKTVTGVLSSVGSLVTQFIPGAGGGSPKRRRRYRFWRW